MAPGVEVDDGTTDGDRTPLKLMTGMLEDDVDTFEGLYLLLLIGERPLTEVGTAVGTLHGV